LKISIQPTSLGDGKGHRKSEKEFIPEIGETTAKLVSKIKKKN